MRRNANLLISLYILFLSAAVMSQTINTDSLLIAAENEDDYGKAQTYLSLAQSYYGKSLSNYTKYGLKARYFADLSGNEDVLSEANNILGIAYHFSGKPDSAIYYYKQALSYSTKQNDTANMLNALRNIGITYEDIGLLTKTNDYYNRAFILAKLSKDSLGMAKILSSMAYAFSSDMKFDKSVEASLKALEIAEKNNYLQLTGDILTSLSITFARIEDYEKALYYQRQSMLKDIIQNDKRDIAASYSNLGLIFKKMGILDSAEYYYNRSLKLKKELGEVNNLVIIYDNIGSLKLMREQYQEALDIYFEGLRLAREGQLIEDQIRLLTGIGDVYYEMGNFSRSDSCYQKSLELSKKGNTAESTIKLYKQLYELNKKTGKTERALYYSDIYHTIKDSIFDIEKQKQLNEIETKYQTEKKDNEIQLLTKEKTLRDAEIHQKSMMQYALVGLILLLLAVGMLIFSRYRLKQQNIQNRLEKEKLESESKLLRSQMNPHFIFNSLNSIQSFISSNEPFKAMSYLSKFGKLIRNIMEFSRHSYVSLAEETDSLKIYIELEILRMKNNIIYTMKIDEDIDTETALIPPMIIQPVVENALKHGLGPKQGDGLLEVGFTTRNDHIICTVTDNGIGRKASQNSKEKGHHSLGMKITDERLHKLNKGNTGIKLTITDLYDNAGKATGTKVIIVLPTEPG